MLEDENAAVEEQPVQNGPPSHTSVASASVPPKVANTQNAATDQPARTPVRVPPRRTLTYQVR